MLTQITNFNSIKKWKEYCFGAHSLYLKNPHFRKWISKKEIYIFNLSSLKIKDIRHIKSGLEDAIRLAKLHFKVFYGDIGNFKKIINSGNKKISSAKLLKAVIEERKKNHKEPASIFVFNNPIKSQDSVIEDGEALTYVAEGATIFSFDAFKHYPPSFLMRRAKHEALHILGLNSHHEDTKVKGYNSDVLCNMNFNAPTQNLCPKCKDGLLSFWEGIKNAT